MSPLRPLSIAIAMVASTVLVVSASSEKSGPQSSNSSRARVSKVHATADTEMVLDEMFVATDGRGHLRAVSSGPLPIGRREAIFVIVDVGTGQYHVVRLLSDVQSNARRIQAIYRRFGVDMSEQHIEERLLRKNEAVEERIREFLAGKGAQGGGEPNLGTQSCGASVDRRGPFAEDDAQWAWKCHDWGYAEVQTWEPARYVAPFAELADTYTSADWLHDTTNSTFDYINGYGSCWANPDTLIDTY